MSSLSVSLVLGDFSTHNPWPRMNTTWETEYTKEDYLKGDVFLLQIQTLTIW